VITFHSSEYERAGGRFEGGLSKAIRDAERDATHAADRVVAVSDDLRQQLLWLYELPSEKVVVVHTGIGLHPGEPLPDVAAAKAARGIGPADPVFIFIGDLTPETGPDLLISAVPRIVGASPSVHFVFVGEGPLRAGLLQRASDLGVARNVHFTGRIADDELWQLLSASDAAIFPCRSPRPLGSVLLAWSAGKPVIATHTGPAELVWHDVTGLKVYPHEASLAWGIERLLHDPEFGRWMGRNGRVAVDEAFTWDAVARKLHGVYSH
jgi:glycosyltransferase involved in cell wall biosynthesis